MQKGPAHPRVPEAVTRALDEIGVELDAYELSDRSRAQRPGRGHILECVFAAWGLIDAPEGELNRSRVLNVAQILERKHAAAILNTGRHPTELPAQPADHHEPGRRVPVLDSPPLPSGPARGERHHPKPTEA